MADKPEILVHVGAPSAAGDDARYRALVESILVFEPVSHHSIFRIYESDNGADLEVSADDSRSELGTPRREQTTMSFTSGDELCSLVAPSEQDKPIIAGSSRQPKESAVPPKSASFPVESPEEDSYLSFQSLIPLSHSVLTPDKPESSTKAVTSSSEAESRTSPIVDIRDEPSTWDTPLDVIPDSQENEVAAADHTILEDSVQVDRSFVPDSARQSRHFEPSKEWIAEESRLSDITRIPSSVPSPSPERSSDRHVDSNQTTSEEENQRTQSSPLLPHESNTSSVVLGKRKSAGRDDANNNASTSSSQPTTNVADISSSSSGQPKKRQTLPQATEIISFTTLPIEIRSPNPPVSNAKFRTHITPTLQSLSERMNHPSRFTPTRQTRTLQPLERGYWFIPCITIIPDTTTTSFSTNTTTQTWPQTFFSQFWCFLRDFLTEGRAGWGIWCLLEESAPQSQPQPPTSSTKNPQADTKKIAVVNLKVYTWGEVAPHIYLLLFLATERQIKKMRNVEWRDARDEAVIVM